MLPVAHAAADPGVGIPPSGPVWWQSYAEYTPLDVWRAGDEVAVCIHGESFLSDAWADWERAMGDDMPRYRLDCERYNLLIVSGVYLNCPPYYACSLPGLAQAPNYDYAIHEIGHAMFGLAHIPPPHPGDCFGGHPPAMAGVYCGPLAVQDYEHAYAMIVKDGCFPAWWEIADDGSWRHW